MLARGLRLPSLVASLPFLRMLNQHSNLISSPTCSRTDPRKPALPLSWVTRCDPMQYHSELPRHHLIHSPRVLSTSPRRDHHLSQNMAVEQIHRRANSCRTQASNHHSTKHLRRHQTEMGLHLLACQHHRCSTWVSHRRCSNKEDHNKDDRLRRAWTRKGYIKCACNSSRVCSSRT